MRSLRRPPKGRPKPPRSGDSLDSGLPKEPNWADSPRTDAGPTGPITTAKEELRSPMSDPVKTTTVKNYLKDTTGLRVGADAAETMAALLTEVAAQVASEAARLASADDRSTLKSRDLEAAFEAFLQSRGPSLLSPATIHAAIDGIDNDGLAGLIRLLRQEG